MKCSVWKYLAIVFFALRGAVSIAGDAVWGGTTGNWTDPSLWTSTPTGHFPSNGTAGEDWSATINSGRVTLTSNIVLDTFTFNDGTIVGPFGISTTKTSTWNSGTLVGGATLTVPLNTSLAIAGGFRSKGITQSTLVNYGTIESSSRLSLNTGANVLNHGSMILTGGGSFTSDSSDGARVVNTGTITTRGDGANTSLTVDTSGSIVVEAGILNIQGIARTGSTIQIEKDANLEIYGSGPLTLESGATITGLGNLTVRSTLETLGTIQLDHLTLTGIGALNGPGTFNIRNSLAWTGGAMNGNGRTVIEAGAVLNMESAGSIPESFSLNRRTLENRGTLNFVNSNPTAGSSNLGGGGKLENSGTINLGQSVSLSTPLINTGTVVTNPGAERSTVINSTVTTTGVVRVDSGALYFWGKNNTAGNGATFIVADSARLSLGEQRPFDSRIFTLGTGVTLTGQPGSIWMQYVDVAGDVTTTSLSMRADSHLQGDGVLTLTGMGAVDGAYLRGTGKIRVAENATLQLSGSVKMNRMVENAGTLVLGNDLSISRDSSLPGSGEITNSGTLRNVRASGYNYVSVPFVNTVRVKLESGAVSFSSFRQTAGTLSLEGGSAGGSFDFVGGGIVGTGTISSSSNIKFSGPVTIGSGIKTMIGTGGMVDLLSSGTLTFGIAGLTTGNGYGRLTFDGTFRLGGKLEFAATDEFVFLGDTDYTFELISAKTLSGAFSNVASGSTLFPNGGSVPFTVYYGSTSPFGANKVVITTAEVVPEPSTIALVAMGVLHLVGHRRRRPL